MRPLGTIQRHSRTPTPQHPTQWFEVELQTSVLLKFNEGAGAEPGSTVSNML